MAGSQFVAPKSDKKEPQMVTIRRVMEPSSSEPTVTITLKGDKPGHDKVLFTLVNGQGIVFIEFLVDLPIWGFLRACKWFQLQIF